jgi:hypothetical protein
MADEPSRHVLRFLQALSAHAWGAALYGGSDGLWVKLIRRGLQGPTRPGNSIAITAAESPALELGISATVPDGRVLDFMIELRHNGESWIIEPYVWVEVRPDEEGPMKVVRSFPVRRAATLDDCFAELGAAITELASSDDVLDYEL